jgi:DNA ligase (NAD+)
MDIDGISEQTLARFINEGWIKNYGDIFRLGSHTDEIRELDGFGEKSAANLNASLEKARTVQDQKLIYALNIPLVGQDVAKRLLNAYPLAELVRTARETEDPAVFSMIEGIGPEKSQAFVRWFQDETNAADFQDLAGELTIRETEKTETGQKCLGLTFVVTGDVHHYKNRNELKAYIESQGGKVTGSVSKNTDFLINNDVESTSSKNTKAKSLGIPIISEDEFVERFGKD